MLIPSQLSETIVSNQNIYHITSLKEWEASKSRGKYAPQGFAKEQFIHCSYRHQLLAVAHRFYKEQNGLVILVIESSKMNSSLVEENLEGGLELYPHLYGLLPTDAVSKVVAFDCDANGEFTLPDEL